MCLMLLMMLIGLPILEIAVLVTVGGRIGFWWTLAVVLITAVLGMAIIVNHGFAAAHRVQQALQRGEPPMAPMLDGAMIVFAGVLLVTPGLIADTIGLAMLVSPLRVLMARGLGRSLFDRLDIRTSTPGGNERFRHSEAAQGRGSATDAGPVIEGEFTRVEEPTNDPRSKRSDGPTKS